MTDLGFADNGPVPFTRGGTAAWAYDHRGIFAFSNEIWNLMEEALASYDIEFDRMCNQAKTRSLKLVNSGSHILCWRIRFK